jgi:hypothetical protein
MFDQQTEKQQQNALTPGSPRTKNAAAQAYRKQ